MYHKTTATTTIALMKKKTFQQIVWNFYRTHRRHDLPWRKTNDPYKILVSEIMLQQTQVPRVVEKYTSFLRAFPTLDALARTSHESLLREWKGLGYNRRALNLKRTAERIVTEFNGNVPRAHTDLISLPGIGPYTAAAIQVFTFNKPVIVIETNIRTVFIKHFFEDTPGTIPDRDITPIIEKTLDTDDPRMWYWALMDYGAHIKKIEKNYSRQSALYARQSAFRGSNRENRSRILSLLLAHSALTKQNVLTHLPDRRTEKNLEALCEEGFITKRNGVFTIA